jgi:D-alanine-D-alanine ligase-like ATP-grasp enzyme
MFPVLWDRMGLQYGDLITELVELARERRLGLR